MSNKLTEWQRDISTQVARVDERTKMMMDKLDKLETSTSNALGSLHNPGSCPTTVSLDHHLGDHTKRDRKNLFYIGVVVAGIIAIAELLSNFMIT